MVSLIFAVAGTCICTALFLLWGFYRKWQLTNRHISFYLAACFLVLNFAVNMALTSANILVEQGDFYLRHIRHAVIVIIFVIIYLFLRSILIDFFDTIDRAQKKWLTHGALILALFYLFAIMSSVGQGIATQRGLLPLDTVNLTLIHGPFILIIILYMIGRRFLPQKSEV